MAFVETYLVQLLIALAALAVLLGLLAQYLAARLALGATEAANDARFDQAKIAHRTRRAASRAALELAPPPGSRAAKHRRPKAPHLPELARIRAAKVRLKRVS